MDLSLEAIKLPAWDPASAAEWDEAFEKVENYLRACRVASRLHRARLTALILQRAFARREREAAGGATAATPLATIAIEETQALVTHWLSGLLPPRAEDRPFTLAEGFLALYLCDAPMRWPNAFLNPQQAPPEFKDTLQARLVKTGPKLEISSMVPRPMDFGLLSELAESAFETLDRIPLIKTLLAWALFAAGLILLFYYTRR